jgi:hypothetical protein
MISTLPTPWWLRRNGTSPLVRTGRKRRHLARLAQHLVHFRGVHLLRLNHLPREFLQTDELAFDQSQQLAIEVERLALGLR